MMTPPDVLLSLSAKAVVMIAVGVWYLKYTEKTVTWKPEVLLKVMATICSSVRFLRTTNATAGFATTMAGQWETDTEPGR